MATIEEVRSKLKSRLSKYKVSTPTRVAYLGDGRGNATSNIVPPGEPDKYWARESLDGDKPFKVLNRNPEFTPAFNLPVLLGYPEDDPTEEQVMGLHRALIKFSIGNSGSALAGVSPHHTKHEWGGGDEVFVDPRQIKPGLVKPTAPPSMAVKVLSFQHYYNDWDRFDGGVTDDMTQYKPASDYRYVLITLEPDSNEIRLRPGNVFTPDLSIDSIISNQANNTFRHIPVPPGNEIPLGCVLLEPTTTKIDWNLNGVNNLLPMRILLGSPMKEINERLALVEAATGITTVPTTGAANSNPYEYLLPARIDGNITRIVHNRSSASELLPTLLVGEIAFVNNSPSRIVVGTASGNHLFGGGGATTLDELNDVNTNGTNDQFFFKYQSATSTWIGASSFAFGTNPSGIAIDSAGELITFSAPFSIETPGQEVVFSTGGGVALNAVNNNAIQMSTQQNGAMYIGGISGNDNDVVINAGEGGGTRLIGLNNSQAPQFEFTPSTGFRFATTNISSALDIRYNEDEIVFNASVVRFTTNNYPSALNISRSLNQIRYTAASLLYSTEDVKYQGGSIVYDPQYLRFSTAVNSSALQINQDGRVYFGREERSSATPFYIDYALGETRFGGTHDFKIATSSNSSALVVDKDLGAVQIGTSVAGQIADFRDHVIEFNKNQNDTDVKIHGTSQNALVIDAGNNRVGVGTDTPVGTLHVFGTELITFQNDNAAPVVLADYYNANTTDANGATLRFTTDTTGAGATAGTTLANIFGSFDTHNHATRTGSLQFRTAQNGTFATRIDIRAGVQVGAPTGGDKGAGTINVATNIYKNNTAYTNPDYALEYWATGRIEKYKENEGAKNYRRLSIEESERYVKENFRLPRITDEPAGIFDMADIALEKIEELHTYIYELNHKIKHLESELKNRVQLEDKLEKLEARLLALEK